MPNRRADHTGPHRSVFEKNRRIILATQDVCGICGQIVDKTIKFPDPMCAVIDHIIPLDKGGSPDDIDNLQLAHMCCNRAKSDKIIKGVSSKSQRKAISNRNLPQTCDWTAYKS